MCESKSEWDDVKQLQCTMAETGCKLSMCTEEKDWIGQGYLFYLGLPKEPFSKQQSEQERKNSHVRSPESLFNWTVLSLKINRKLWVKYSELILLIIPWMGMTYLHFLKKCESYLLMGVEFFIVAWNTVLRPLMNVINYQKLVILIHIMGFLLKLQCLCNNVSIVRLFLLLISVKSGSGFSFMDDMMSLEKDKEKLFQRSHMKKDYS